MNPVPLSCFSDPQETQESGRWVEEGNQTTGFNPTHVHIWDTSPSLSLVSEVSMQCVCLSTRVIETIFETHAFRLPPQDNQTAGSVRRREERTSSSSWNITWKRDVSACHPFLSLFFLFLIFPWVRLWRLPNSANEHTSHWHRFLLNKFLVWHLSSALRCVISQLKEGKRHIHMSKIVLASLLLQAVVLTTAAGLAATASIWCLSEPCSAAGSVYVSQRENHVCIRVLSPSLQIFCLLFVSSLTPPVEEKERGRKRRRCQKIERRRGREREREVRQSLMQRKRGNVVVGEWIWCSAQKQHAMQE